MRKIVFFETENWDEKFIKENFDQAYRTSDKLNEENVTEFEDVEIISTFIYSDLSNEVLAKLPNLKLIATRSTGFDHIDLQYCKLRNIAVCNVPEYGSNTVAEHTFALILSLTRKIYESVNQAKQLNFDHRQIIGVDVYGKTLGIIGLGKIGLNVLRIAHGFKMKILVHTRTQNQDLKELYGIEYVDLENLLSKSDVISLHLPLTKHTKNIINEDNISKIKKGCYLVNTARGGLVQTEAIIKGLSQDILSGVALDVLEEEKDLSEEAEILTKDFAKDANMKKLIMDHYLMNHPRVLITPHNAFNSVEAINRIIGTTVSNIKSFTQGSPTNLV